MEALPVGIPGQGGRYRVAWVARRSGKHTLLVVCNGQTLNCSMKVEVHADGCVDARASGVWERPFHARAVACAPMRGLPPYS